MSNPWEQLTEEDIQNIKRNGGGCGIFLASIIWSVAIVAILHFIGVL